MKLPPMVKNMRALYLRQHGNFCKTTKQRPVLFQAQIVCEKDLEHNQWELTFAGL